MVKPGVDRCLLLEPAAGGLGCHPQLHHLHRHLSRRRDLLADVDASHPSFAEQAENAHAAEIEADERIPVPTIAQQPRGRGGIADNSSRLGGGRCQRVVRRAGFGVRRPVEVSLGPGIRFGIDGVGHGTCPRFVARSRPYFRLASTDEPSVF
jgi:hypothetical protein